MTNAAISTPKPSFSPLRLQSRSLAWQIGAVILGSLFLALSSYIEVPMVPVPVTMQTFAVTLVGALYGWRFGALTIAAWRSEWETRTDQDHRAILSALRQGNTESAAATLGRHVQWIGQKPVKTASGRTRDAFAIVG